MKAKAGGAFFRIGKRMEKRRTVALELNGSVGTADESEARYTSSRLRRLGADKRLLAVAVLILVPFLIWQRNIWANAYARSQIKYELERKGTDYRAVASFDLSRGREKGRARVRVKIRYPFYWDKSSSGNRLVLSFPRYTGSINEMVFEDLPDRLAEDDRALAKSIEAMPRVGEVTRKRDATLGGEIMDIYRYGIGNPAEDGYREYIVAVFPKKSLKVTLIQRYRRGPYVEDDIAMTRMLNVLYGLEFE